MQTSGAVEHQPQGLPISSQRLRKPVKAAISFQIELDRLLGGALTSSCEHRQTWEQGCHLIGDGLSDTPGSHHEGKSCPVGLFCRIHACFSFLVDV